MLYIILSIIKHLKNSLNQKNYAASWKYGSRINLSGYGNNLKDYDSSRIVKSCDNLNRTSSPDTDSRYMQLQLMTCLRSLYLIMTYD